MNKLTLSVAVAVALGLAGCGGESLDDIKQETSNNTVKPYSRVVFDPGAATPRLSVPNDLLFQGTTDGTLTTDAGAAPDYTNPQVALGALDGWSTQNPFAIAVDVAAGASLVASSVQQPGAVRVFEMVMQDPNSPLDECKTADRGFACQAVSELTFGVDFISAVSGNSIAVIPLRPLKPATTYMTVLTSLIEDDNGNSVAPSTSYELVKQDDKALPLSTPSQLALQKLINSFEDAIEAEGVDRDSIIYTAAITTQSVGAVLSTLKSLMASPAPTGYGPSNFVVQNTGLTVSQLSSSFSNPLFNLARLYQGSITLPYYLGSATAENPTAPLSSRWTARCDSGAIIAALPDSMKPEAPVSQNDGVCQALSGGALRDLGVDAARHLTKFNTIPKIDSYKQVAVQMTVPDANAIPMPAAGWPVVILQHGITSCKENMLALTGALSARGFATVAIDHPLHGSRGFGPINASGASCGLSGTATAYMNLQNLLVTRDNLRQSIADMLALRLGLNYVQGVQLDMSNVQVLGHSLGAIAATSMVAVANSASGSDALDAAYNVDSTVLAMPGGAVANFLFDSPAFGPLVKASIMLGAGGSTAESYIAFATQNQGCGAPATPPFAACFTPFTEYLAQTGNTAALTALNSAFTQFAFAAQTVTDAGDPNNYAQRLVVSETPTYVIEVVGDEDNLPDQVIPNGFANPLQALGAGKMALAGTEPLIRLLGAAAIDTAPGQQALAGNAVARFTEGDHGSILSPAASAAATTEMQMQAVSVFMTKGAGVVVTDPAVLQPAN
ncbi:VolA/Pla-1 family phospholipase [Rheinheimera maricola]|uniref:Lipase n=1 Tax=Rheinheimera maricola TaxID=2793282 RepID=A0ABS7X3N3_9GAMM|nr:VolA/Pla-1 family phospholipase [Rheinheimera maricola]MBZ9610166.1 lipase [Rheinheimera maricola]